MQLQSLLDDLVERADDLLGRERAPEFREAWSAIAETRPIETAVELSSFTSVVPGIDPVKEFKESWEAAAEEAYEPPG